MRTILHITIILVSFATSVVGQTNDYDIRLVKNNLFYPWDMVEGPNNEIWFTQKDGEIARLNPSTGQSKTLLQLTDVHLTNGEGGLLGLALHPNFIDTSWVYFVYNYLDGSSNHKEKVVIYNYQNDTLIFRSTVIDSIEGEVIHNGSRLIIKDRKLYVTTGDANVTVLSQDLQSANGKVLCYNMDGSIPTDNPISGSPIWSYGHRNAQGLCVVDNTIFSSEHGPSNDDEINIIEKNRNYGWPDVQGYCNTPAEMSFCTANNVKEPIRAWTPTLAVSGIDYYNHNLFPQWQNALLMTTLKDSKLYYLTLNSAKDNITSQTEITNIDKGRLRDVLVMSNGKIYICTSNSRPTQANDGIYEIYDPTPSTVANTANNKMISITPNPARAEVQLSFVPIDTKAVLKLTNLSGQLIHQKEVAASTSSATIDLSRVPSGMYMVELVGNGIHYTEKLIRE